MKLCTMLTQYQSGLADCYAGAGEMAKARTAVQDVEFGITSHWKEWAKGDRPDLFADQVGGSLDLKSKLLRPAINSAGGTQYLSPLCRFTRRNTLMNLGVGMTGVR